MLLSGPPCANAALRTQPPDLSVSCAAPRERATPKRHAQGPAISPICVSTPPRTAASLVRRTNYFFERLNGIRNRGPSAPASRRFVRRRSRIRATDSRDGPMGLLGGLLHRFPRSSCARLSLFERSHVNQEAKRIGGMHRPPNERLTGRTGVGRILQCDRRTVRRLEESGLLGPALIEPNGVRWFDIEAAKRLAATYRRARKTGSRRRVAKPPRSPKSSGDYRPELRPPRVPVPERPSPPPATTKPQVRSSPPRERRDVGPRTEIKPEWWDGDLGKTAPPKNPAAGAPSLVEKSEPELGDLQSSADGSPSAPQDDDKSNGRGPRE